MSRIFNKLRQQPLWIAIGISVILCLWVASGMLFATDIDDREERRAQKHKENPLVKVTITHINADEVNREISLYGRTEPDRVATLRSEVKALVEKIYVQKGEFVVTGQKILSLEKDDLVNRLKSVKSTLQQREIELDGARSLGKEGYQSPATLAQAGANLQATVSEMRSLELAIYKSDILAPFDGIMNDRYVEVGDLLKDGDEIAMIVDLDPLVITANVTENYVQDLSIGQPAHGRMASGQLLSGEIRYISSVSDLGTNTFKVEVAVPNVNYQQMAGMSTELALPLQKTWAMRITPAVMALDEAGNIGVKTVVDDYVKFVPIDIVKSDSNGVWLAGLGQQADVIIFGHGFVRDGDKVEVVRADQKNQNIK
ncbi:MAG: multidrug efflux system membrane fusion protein [Paraglaciecola sp.]|jgi:multidrug efflux system membrane fusion protein